MLFNRLQDILKGLIIATLAGACQGQSSVEPPKFCTKQSAILLPGSNLDPCGAALAENYINQLFIALYIFPPTGLNGAMSLQTARDIPAPELIRRLRIQLNSSAQPLPLEHKNVYLDDNQKKQFEEFAKKEGPEIAKLGLSVGRLEIKTIEADKSVSYFQWGTAFAIAYDVIATTCHEIEPLIEWKDGKWVLALKNHGQKDERYTEQLWFDFGEIDDRFDSEKYEISDVVVVPDEEGLDVALLFPKSGKFKIKAELGPVPPPIGETKGREVAVVGYPDFHHFIDAGSEQVFGNYKFQGTAKFVSLGCATPAAALTACQGKREQRPFLTHTATTTMGESGGIVVDRENQKVIGIHSCCSYPLQDDSPQGKLKCAHLKSRSINRELNQAISICALFKNQQLKDALKAHGVMDPCK